MGFLRSKSTPPPMAQLPVPKLKKKVAETTQPGDMGGGSSDKGKGRGGTILTSVAGVTDTAQLGTPTLLGGMY